MILPITAAVIVVAVRRHRKNVHLTNARHSLTATTDTSDHAQIFTLSATIVDTPLGDNNIGEQGYENISQQPAAEYEDSRREEDNNNVNEQSKPLLQQDPVCNSLLQQTVNMYNSLYTYSLNLNHY